MPFVYHKFKWILIKIYIIILNELIIWILILGEACDRNLIDVIIKQKYSFTYILKKLNLTYIYEKRGKLVYYKN